MASEVNRPRRDLFRLSPARILTAFLMIVFAAVCLFAPADTRRWTGQHVLNDQGTVLIDESLERTQTTFLTLSAIKAGIALFEGSTVGIGVEVQVGDIVQPAYDYVDFFWQVFLYSFVLLGAYKILLETGMLELGIVLIGVGALFFAINLISPTEERTSGIIGRRCVLIGLLVAYMVPLSLLATNFLSERYTVELKQTHLESIEAFQAELSVAQTQFLDLRTRISLLSPNESVDSVKTGLLAIAGSVAESFRLSLLAFLYYVLLTLFDLLFFPLISAWVLYKIAQVAMDRALQLPTQTVEVQLSPANGT